LAGFTHLLIRNAVLVTISSPKMDLSEVLKSELADCLSSSRKIFLKVGDVFLPVTDGDRARVIHQLTTPPADIKKERDRKC
jgi:hypothetical protein